MNKTLPTSRIYTPQFNLLCLSSFLFYISFSMIIPELPAYLSSLGGGAYKGLIIGLFTLTAGLSRPFSGKLADLIGRKPVIFIGIMMSVVCGLLYPVLITVGGFLFLRLLHGFSTGFAPTGTSAFIADIVPADRRGEAMGMLGLISNIGTAVGSAIGGEIVRYISIDGMFYVASGSGVLAMLLLLKIEETLAEKRQFEWQMLQLKSDEILEQKVFSPAFVMILGMFSFGVVLTVIPDFSTHLGLENKGLFFTVYVLSSLLMRFLAGKASDLYGRVVVVRWAMAILAIGLLVIAYAETAFVLLAGACIVGISTGMSMPTLFAWTIDLSDAENRGRAFATLYIALEVGIFSGAMTSGWLFANQIQNIPVIFLISAVLAVVAWGYLQFWGKTPSVKEL
jgi:MFS family permease